MVKYLSLPTVFAAVGGRISLTLDKKEENREYKSLSFLHCSLRHRKMQGSSLIAYNVLQ